MKAEDLIGMKKILPPVIVLSIMAMVFILAMALNPSLNYDQVKNDPIDLNSASQKELESLREIGQNRGRWF